MISISDKSECCACSACVSVCPRRCITMQEDEEGFLYPKVDEMLCVNCNLCHRVCPILHQCDPKHPLEVYAAKNTNEQIRLSSSSGGIFTQLAEKVIDENGVVFGARFNDKWEVVHDCIYIKDKISVLRGAKYVQSRMGDSFIKVRHLLSLGRKVMFTGTPCQIAGLKKYLGKDYDNLLTVDVVCHVVPSPIILQKYLNEQLSLIFGKTANVDIKNAERNSLIKNISFRDKKSGWKKYSVSLALANCASEGVNCKILSSVFSENLFMNIFLSNLSLRPSCFVCPAKTGKSCSDITLGDFWGIEHVLPDFDDDKGCSVVLINSSKGRDLFTDLICEKRSVSYNQAVEENRCIAFSTHIQPNRALFFRKIAKGETLQAAWTVCCSMQLKHRIQRFIYRNIKT